MALSPSRQLRALRGGRGRWRTADPAPQAVSSGQRPLRTSPIEAAATAIDIHNTAAQWNKALLDNSARPSGALVYTGGEGRMTAEQFRRLREELEAGFQGARQAGRPLLLEGGLDWKALLLLSPPRLGWLSPPRRGLTPKDMMLCRGGDRG